MTLRRLALVLVAVAPVAMAGCNNAAKSQARDLSDAASFHGDLAAAKAESLFSDGRLARPANVGRTPVTMQGFRPVQLLAVYVAEHPSVPDKQVQAGYIEVTRNEAGASRWVFKDTEWERIGSLDEAGLLRLADGSAPWATERLSVQDAARRLYSKGPHVGVNSANYLRSTYLPFRSGAGYQDDSFEKRGVQIVKKDDTLSIRPLVSGEMNRMARGLTKAEFDAVEKAKQDKAKADREAAKARDDAAAPAPNRE